MWRHFMAYIQFGKEGKEEGITAIRMDGWMDGRIGWLVCRGQESLIIVQFIVWKRKEREGEEGEGA